MPQALAARTALVSGANRGIGRAVCEQLAALGAHVIAACRDRETAKETAAALAGAPLILDLAQPAQVEQAAETLRERAVDILINNGGLYPQADVLSGPLTDFREAMEVHFFAVLALCRALVPGMVTRGFGRVVNVSSDYGSLSDGLAGPAAYSLSKAALNALTLKLARELPADADVKVNALCPGWVRTRMGGSHAPVAPEDAARRVLELVLLDPSGPSGRFFQDGRELPW